MNTAKVERGMAEIEMLDKQVYTSQILHDKYYTYLYYNYE
jgi:hypothetical protein